MTIDYENIKVSDYFQLHLEMTKKYGKNTLVLMQVGGFHELYSTDKDGPDLDLIGDQLDVLTTKKNKNKTLSKTNPYMMGFPNHSLGKYIELLIKESYLLVIVSQVSTPPKPKRKITNVITPSTYNNTTNSSGNYLISLIIDAGKSIDNEETIEIGLSAIELSLGDIYYHQGFSQKGDSNFSLDDAFRFIQTFKPTEVVFCNVSKQNIIGKFTIKQICEYLKLPKNTIELSYSKISPLKKITFQKRKFNKLFNNNLELLENINIFNLARISLFQMFYYIERIDEDLTLKMKTPNLFYNENKLYLGNRALNQLNFSKDDKLYQIINLTKTPMGKRYFEMILSNPNSNPTVIQQKYDDLLYLYQNPINKDLFMNIYDLDRINRKVLLGTATPLDIYKLYSSLESSNNIFTNIQKSNHKKFTKNITEIIHLIENTFDIEKIKFINNLDIEESFFNPKNTSFTKINSTQNNINKIYEELENKRCSIENLIDEGKFIKNKTILKLDKNLIDGFYFSCTKKRGLDIEKKNNKSKLYNLNFVYQKTTAKIKADFLDNAFSMKNKYEAMLTEHTKEIFISFLNDLQQKYYNIIQDISASIAYYDFINSGAQLIDKYHYTIPIIKNSKKSKNHSYFSAKQLRHPLVEQILDEEYIPQDISLDNKLRGILLFGVNSAGKSTLMKSIGISVLLAQIGYPVPATKFTYYPYQSIFTRISGNDDIMKGLSSFMVEIMELNSILKRNNKNTLVIADELCRGTEVESALYIVATMIEKLAQNNCSFITASHLHGLKTFKNIKKIEKVKPYHLKVEYKDNKLIYNRKLLPGYGSSYYGIEIAKYIFEDNKLIDRIYEISNHFEEIKSSKYNSEIIMENCEICKSKDNLETHHIVFQKDFIKNKHKTKFHLIKNNKCNLVTLCQSCHDEVDRNNINIKGWKNNKLIYSQSKSSLNSNC